MDDTLKTVFNMGMQFGVILGSLSSYLFLMALIYYKRKDKCMWKKFEIITLFSPQIQKVAGIMYCVVLSIFFILEFLPIFWQYRVSVLLPYTTICVALLLVSAFIYLGNEILRRLGKNEKQSE